MRSMNLQLQNVTLVTQDFQPVLQNFESKILQAVEEHQARPFNESATRNRQLRPSEREQSEPDPNSSSQDEARARDYFEFRALQTDGESCQKWCSCICHRRTAWSSPALLQNFFGQLLVGYTGRMLAFQTCDIKECKTRKSGILVKYRFPSWFIGRIVWLLARSYSGTPELILRMPRVRGYSETDLFTFAADGNINAIKKMFLRREASPFDVQPDGRSALRANL